MFFRDLRDCVTRLKDERALRRWRGLAMREDVKI